MSADGQFRVLTSRRGRGLAAAVLCALAMLAAHGCGDDDAIFVPPGPGPEDLSVEYLYGAEWLNPRPQGNWLIAVTAVAGGNTFAVGARGTVIERDGSNLKVHKVGDDDLTAVWANAPDDVIAAAGEGRFYHYDGASWTLLESPAAYTVFALHGLAGDDVWGVSTRGEVIHYDGASWTLMVVLDTKSCFAIWEVAPNHVLVGGRTNIEQWDGTSWSVAYVSPDSALITDFWGRSPTEVYAVGHEATLLRFDGSSWEPLAADSSLNFVEVGGSDTEMWATLTERSRFAKIVGTTVTIHDLPWGEFLIDLVVRGPGDAMVVGQGGGIATLRGNEWRLDSSRYGFPLKAITAYEGAPCAFGDRVSYLRVEGDGVRRVSIDAANVSDAWSADGDEIVIVGSYGSIRRGRDDRWTRDSSGTEADLLAVHGTSPSDVWAVGQSETVLHFDGMRWTKRLLPADWYYYGLNDVWAAGPNDVYVASGELLHYDGATWTRIEMNDLAPQSIWGRSPTEIYVVGERGIVRYDGQTVTVMREGSLDYLEDVHGNARGDVCAVGRETILWLVDGVWVEATNPADEDLTGVWVGEDGFAYVVGESGAVLRVRRPGA